jgi:hypothetical protein
MEYREGINCYWSDRDGEKHSIKEECTPKSIVRTNLTTGEIQEFGEVKKSKD